MALSYVRSMQRKSAAGGAVERLNRRFPSVEYLKTTGDGRTLVARSVLSFTLENVTTDGATVKVSVAEPPLPKGIKTAVHISGDVAIYGASLVTGSATVMEMATAAYAAQQEVIAEMSQPAISGSETVQ